MTPLPSFDEQRKIRSTLDLRDKKIINALVQNARQPFTEIAKVTNLSKESVQYRFHQLLKKELILRTYAEIDYEILGFHKFHLLLLLDEAKQEQHKELLLCLQEHPNFLRVLEFSDCWDFEIVMLARTLQEFDCLVSELLQPFEKMILRKELEAVVSVQSTNSFPEIAALKLPDFSVVDHSTKLKTKQEITLDLHDLRILSLLCGDARLSTYKMSPEVGLSADAIGLRIKKLQRAGVIKGYTCQLNFSDLDYHGYVFCFSTAVLKKSEEKKFLYYAARNPYVLSVKKTLGVWDLKNYVVVRNPAEFHRLIKDMKQQFSNLLQHYDTWVIYREFLFTPFPKILLRR